MEIGVMARRGEGIREIARQLGCSRNTVRRYLRQQQASRYAPRAARGTKLDAYKPYLLERVQHARPQWIPATVLLREIAERGYSGGISQLKAWLAPLKQVAIDPVVRFETAPGQQIRADFTWATAARPTSSSGAARMCRRCARGCLRRSTTSAVCLSTCYSTTPRPWCCGEGLHRWNERLSELAEECGFVPRLCLPYRAVTGSQPEGGGSETARRRGQCACVPLVRRRVAAPIESLQHSLVVYDELLEALA